MTNIFDQDLDKNPANYTPLSPVSFIERSAEIFGDLPSVVHGNRRYTWAQTRERSARLAAACFPTLPKWLKRTMQYPR
jgi:fatty-acyl-CoA synthase